MAEEEEEKEKEDDERAQTKPNCLPLFRQIWSNRDLARLHGGAAELPGRRSTRMAMVQGLGALMPGDVEPVAEAPQSRVELSYSGPPTHHSSPFRWPLTKHQLPSSQELFE